MYTYLMSLSIFIIYNLKDNQAQNINLPSASTRRDVTMAIRIAIAPILSGTIFTIYAKNKNYYKTNSGSREKNTQLLRSAFDTINNILANYKTDVK